MEIDLCDFHSHILPKCDHGSSSVEVSLGQMELAKKYGVSRIVATSHFYPQDENVETFVKRREHCAKKLVEALNGSGPKIVLGAEILICDNIEDMEGFDKLCFGKSKTCLIELPFTVFDEKYVTSAYNLINDGYNVILAHADRYDPKNIEKMLEVGAKIQLNADSLARLFKRRELYDWLRREKVVALGSDIHRVDEKAYKRFDIAKKKIEKYIDFVKEQSDKMWQNFETIN